MQTFLSILLVLTSIFFCAGLIVPKTINQNLNRKRVFAISIGLFMLFGFVSASLPKEPEQVGPKIQAVEIKPEEVAFDIPPIIKSRTIEDVVKALGKPSNDTEPTGLQVQQGTNEWDKKFTAKSGQELLVTYNPKTRTVIDYFFPLNTSSTAALLKLGNLNPDSPFYRAEPVQALTLPLGNYTGIKVTPRR